MAVTNAFKLWVSVPVMVTPTKKNAPPRGNRGRRPFYLKEWRKFKAGRIYTADGFDYLRFNPKTGRVETSQRVEIPEPVARRFYAFVLDTISGGGCSNCNMKLMDMYEVIDINKEYIRVGCHKISLKEIRSFTKKLNW